ncbi:glycosyl hydrolase family 32 [Streptococcus gallolyticus subsp. gallolyticus]|uniref:GH32 C-terminal domain-containing protein n=1 Tax=Streptococcus gallolyticus TaxID=315405 RepID=UPI0007E2F0D7|nr:GH32 C-terminal domain-containing protein [Streptococcus gallolyticus]MCY7179324.1 GH32 C-terminal domain-containing protein [Streptococcus gallolyticus subsp. gallolyticus]MCY7194734.1 GH32 C-terminal domain-containing protein [Streptococcus gallolyticus subsp. gallolyticus]OAV81792.1 glycosyl hydrolase family 32 [Streptococcus gallolyticus subsp. gallolyticus]OCW48342.1 glycosyl hydrolase family 32 [Streptococcus gallolyticus subsp. gallolyticus]
MKKEQEKKCVNWFMHKRGKQWIYGCGVLVCGIVLGTVATPVMADEAVSSPMELVTVADVNADNNTNTDQKTEVDQETQQPANQVETPENQTPIEQGVVGEQNQKVTEENQVTENQDVTQQNQVTENQEPATKTQDDAQKTETTDAEEKVEVTDSLKQKADQPNESTEKARKALSTNLTTKKESSYNTNLQGLSYDANVWEVREDGLYSNAIGEGDSFLLSTSAGKNFVFQTDVTFLQNTGAASLVFRSTGDAQNLKGYVVNLDGNSHKIKFMRWGEANLIDEKEIEATSDNKYSLKVVAANGWISYYINGILVANLSDYTIQRDDRGQTTYIKDGNFGLLNWNGEMIFQNTFYRELTDAELPILKDVTVSSKNGPVEPKGQFFPEGAVYIQYVSHDASTVDLSFVPNNQDAVIKVTDDQGNVYSDPSNIPVSVGANYLTVTSTYTVDGYEVTSTYRINVHRRQSAEVYYNENFRDQYHYSVKDGWANDPNGLVYYNGVYHMFYQFYDDIQWGPMHWAHATSTDLIHWEDQPIAFYPDYNGAMFSGCIVADPNNTSGLFEGDKGGLVALITADGEGQRIKVAYSKDEGKTWQKLDEVAADWSTDPLQNRDFRDPKVFRWEGKWFMVLAGGPLRIYSSDNLLDWSVESTYPDLHTECPDLYPIMAEGNTVKWVLSRGGRYYKVGDLKQVDGHWKFVADADYQESDGIMNFGKDSYAAMTYYVQDFGTKDNPTIPQIIELNWMNTWDNYCNLVAERTGQKFNGTFNLNLTLGLVKDGDKYVLTQTPIKAYESLRDVDHKVEYKDVVVGKDNNLFKDFSGDTYEIVAHFKPSDRTTKVGFNLRVGQGEVTKVYYDLQTGRIAIDRSQSGIILTELFRNVDSQAVTRNADGSIDLHIFVDRASVEVFTKGGTVTGANQIFTSPQSLGLGVFAEGYEAKADIALYPLKSIWKDKVETTKPQSIVPASAKNVRMNVGDSTVVKAYVSPAVVNQDLLWSILNNGNVSTEISGNQVFVKALKKGQVIVRAQSKTDPSVYQDFVLDILEDNFKTNVKNVKVFAGDWHADGESLKVENHNSNDIYMAADKMPYENYQMDLDIKYGRGVVNIFFASGNPDANNAYSIQFGGDNSVRLFRFYSDTISESQMTAAINDNQFHHVRLVKSANAIQVFVDNQLAMSYTFDQVEDFFNNPYIGLGLWDGELEVQNFFVVDLDAKEPTQNEEKVEVVPTDPQTPAEQVVTTTTLAAKAPAKSEKATDAKAPVIPKTALVSETVLPQTGEKDSHLAGLGIVSILAAMGAFFGQFFKKKES